MRMCPRDVFTKLYPEKESDAAHLFHDTRLALRESDVTAGFVLDEFYLDLSPLATWLVIIVIIVISSGADTRTLHAAVLSSRCTIAGRKRVILSRR